MSKVLVGTEGAEGRRNEPQSPQSPQRRKKELLRNNPLNLTSSKTAE
jgi:hypothetical protein